MKKTLFAVIILTIAIAQPAVGKNRTIALWGHVFDSFTHHGLPAKITLMLRDSTVVDTTTAANNSDAAYCFDIPAKNEHYIIRAVMEGYDTCYVDYYVHNIVRNDYFDAPWHYMKRRRNASLSGEHDLDEVVVTGTKIRMVQRGDTIIYDASAFNLPEGSMLDALVRQLPGAELKANGDIYVNGRKIDYLTLNGTDFFKGKNKVMLDNLPYYVVKNVKVYNKSSERSRFLQQDVEKKDYVMDVSLKKEYSTGMLGNVEAGAGSDERYIARLFGLLFTDKSRFSAYGNTNNVNETRQPGGQGDWNPSYNQQGLTKAKQGGFDYSYKNEKLEERLNATANWTDTDNETRTRTENNATGANIFNDSHSSQRSKSMYISASNMLRYNELVNHPFSFYMRTQLMLNNGKVNSTRQDSTYQQSFAAADGNLLTNRSRYYTYSHTHSLAFAHNIDFIKKLPWGDNLELTAGLRYMRNDPGDSYSSQQVEYMHRDSIHAPFEQRNYYADTHQHGYIYNGDIHYHLKFLNGLDMENTVSYEQEWNGFHNLNYTENAIDYDNSNIHANLARHYKYTIGLNWGKTIKKGNSTFFTGRSNINANLTAEYVTERMHYDGAGLDTIAHRNYFLLKPNGSYYLNFGLSELYFRYDMEANVPDFATLMPYEDTRNALSRRINNPHLKTSYKHHPYLVITLRDSIGNRWFVASSFNYNYNSWGTRTMYDRQTGAYTYMQDNVGTQWDEWFNVRRFRYLDDKKRLSLEYGVEEYLQRSKDFAISYDGLSGDIYTVSIFSAGGTAKLTYQRGKLTTTVDGKFGWCHVGSGQEGFTTLKTWDYQYGATLNYTLPWDITIATDMRMYSRRGYSLHSMNTDDLVWNALVSRSFFKGKLTAKLQAFDILHQLSSTEYSVNAQGHTETWHNSIPRYVMFSLAWKFNKNPKKK